MSKPDDSCKLIERFLQQLLQIQARGNKTIAGTKTRKMV